MRKITTHSLFELKANKEPITVLTAYDSTFSQLVSRAGVEVILVGDSLGMVIQGHDSTVPVSMEEMRYHTKCVANGNQSALVIADLPYMAYAELSQTLTNAATLMQAGANMVKLEGGQWLVPSVKALTERGIPVCAHLGLTPQSVDALGGFKVQGRDEKDAERLIEDALALEQAGACLLVLECIPASLAAKVTSALKIPTIGIGAGAETDGQVLVLQDMLGLNPDFKPKFVQDFMQLEHVNTVSEAVSAFVSAVKSRQFPTSKHSFD